MKLEFYGCNVSLEEKIYETKAAENAEQEMKKQRCYKEDKGDQLMASAKIEIFMASQKR